MATEEGKFIFCSYNENNTLVVLVITIIKWADHSFGEKDTVLIVIYNFN